jgi:hypothetical protein
LEPQRTNLVTFSEQFDNAGWLKQAGITITANTTETLDPSGYYGADKVVSTSGSTGFYQAGLSLTSDITRSIYLKGAVGGETLKLKDPSGFGGNTSVTLTTSWVRYEHKTTNTGDTYQGLFVDDISNGATIYAWGAQLEAGDYATSYIPTLGTSVTRVAEGCLKTGVSSLIGQTEGTLFLDFIPDSKDNVDDFRFQVGVIGSNNWIFIGNVNGKIRGYVRSTSTVFDNESTTTVVGTRYKVAISYSTTAVSFYINGTLIQEVSGSYTIPTCDMVAIQTNLSVASLLSSRVNQALLFKTRLTNQQLQELTSL